MIILLFPKFEIFAWESYLFLGVRLDNSTNTFRRLVNQAIRLNPGCLLAFLDEKGQTQDLGNLKKTLLGAL